LRVATVNNAHDHTRSWSKEDRKTSDGVGWHTINLDKNNEKRKEITTAKRRCSQN